VVSVEFPHLLRLMAGNQFDTIYHEHFSYFSLLTAEQIFAAHGFTVFDVEELGTHGGSLRLYARHRTNERNPVTPRVGAVEAAETAAGLDQIDGYTGFQSKVERVKRELLDFLIRVKREGKRVVGYGAPAKGTTLLNYCGIRQDLLEFTVDKSPHKQGTFLPGVHIPVCPIERLAQAKPDYVLLLPWNLRAELTAQLAPVREWGGRLVVAIPHLEILS
jgi:hypothetical protein